MVREYVPQMYKLLQLTVIQYQVCYKLLHGDNRKSQLVISQVMQVTKQSLDVVQAQHLVRTTISVVRYTDCNNRHTKMKRRKNEFFQLIRELHCATVVSCFSLFSYKHYIWVIDQVWGHDGWILAKFFFACLWTETGSRSINSPARVANHSARFD